MLQQKGMANEPIPPDKDNRVEESFVRILLGDVSAAMQRYDTIPSQQHRRELIRSAFAAIEGYVWLYREHVVEAARLLDKLDFDEGVALSELNYQISEQGKVITQPRFVSLLAIVRLTTRIATRLTPDLDVRFDTADWHHLQKAGTVRNRITHPKSKEDLQLTGDDAATCLNAFFWLLEISTKAMEATNLTLTQFNDDFPTVFEDLKRGNPEVWAMYNAISRNAQD